MCGQKYCSTCKKLVATSVHRCYMQPLKKPKKPKFKGYIYFDFETTQEKVVGRNDCGEVLQHVVNCGIAYKVCSACKDLEIDCGLCGQRKMVFIGDNSLDKFCDWLFSGENMGYLAIAHNAQGFDAQFILDYIHQNAVVKPEIITRGRAILRLKAAEVTIVDSMAFLPMGLAAMPKAFGLVEKQKGYFCHFFNTAANFDYVGKRPDAHYYGPANMKPEARDKFYQW